jgi:ribosome-associated heat shock protein Hsp15
MTGMDEPVRLDKWLWAARMTKTRALAAEAIKAGRVQVNGTVAKPSKELKAGDRVEFRTGPLRLGVVVRGLSARRGPASAAALLYEETPESRAAREELTVAERGERPTKRDRRRLEQVTGRRRDRG